MRAWLKRHPRFVLHFVPTSSSWLNLVERWFGVLDDKAIRRGVFRSVEVCNNCGFQLVRSEDLGELTRLVADEYRRRHGLLTSVEIRERREKLRMSQEGFARYLGAGVASVKRWELGLVQDKAMNELMLLKTDPGKAEEHVRTLRRMLRQPAEPHGRKVTAQPA